MVQIGCGVLVLQGKLLNCEATFNAPIGNALLLPWDGLLVFSYSSIIIFRAQLFMD